MSFWLNALHETVNRRLERIAKLLSDKYRLTLIARHVDDDDAHILWTDDEVALAVAAITRVDAQEREAQAAQKPESP